MARPLWRPVSRPTPAPSRDDPAGPVGGTPVDAGAIASVLAEKWAADPGAPALWCEGATGWCGNGELDRRTAAAAARLAAVGLDPGDRCLWTAGVGLDEVVAALAVLRLGAVLVPANPQWTERELAHVAADVEPAVAVLGAPWQVDCVQAANPGIPVHCVSPGDLTEPADATPPPLDAAGTDDPAMIIFTSGTTGAPKGAVLTQGNLSAGAASLRSAWRWRPEDRLVSALPLFHVHGLCVGLLGSLAAGASLVQLGRFDADAVADAVTRHRATLFFGVPTMYHRLLASGRAGSLRPLRLCVSGSAALSAELWEQLKDEAGIEILERYGSTETLLTVSNPLDGERRPGSIGGPLPGVDVRIDPESAELLVRGPGVFAGYWHRPDATAVAFSGDWFRTGDLVAEDEDGFLRVLGRRTEVIITGGYNVYPAEVEGVLAGHRAVAEVAVGPLASQEWGETVCAWVVAATGSTPTETELLEFAAGQLAPYKRPRSVRFVGELPRNAMGKVVRSRLH